ncbi:MAG: PLD nuclease N-terminal domain-containing protein [Actinomycetia bacterium]|nr:PLD nuclease N-terminal domain-containing protein [Actinomycetes bacterium]
MIRFGLLLTLIAIAIWLYAIFDALLTPADQTRNLPKGAWVVIVLLLPDLGTIAWFILGRPRRADASRSQNARGMRWPSPGAATPFGRASRSHPAHPSAPDDDPEFLRQLAEQLKREPPKD